MNHTFIKALCLITNRHWWQKQYSAKVSMVAKYLWLCLWIALQLTKLLMLLNSVPVVQILDRLFFLATHSQSSLPFSSSSLGLTSLVSLVFFTSCITSLHYYHPNYWQVIQELPNCLYQHNGKDEKMIIGALADGTMNGMKNIPKWNRCYYAFMQKLSTPFEVERIEMQK
jgi:hypothetical protein